MRRVLNTFLKSLEKKKSYKETYKKTLFKWSYQCQLWNDTRFDFKIKINTVQPDKKRKSKTKVKKVIE